MDSLARYSEVKAAAGALYKSIGEVYCPYFGAKVVFNSAGFHHLQFSGGVERGREQQMLKFRLLRVVPAIVKNSGTVQEYRRTTEMVGGRTNRGEPETRKVEYWGFVAITKGRHPIRVKVILRRVGDGRVAFLSVMLDQKRGSDARLQIGR